MKLPLKITIGEKYRPAMEIKTQEEADNYFEDLVEHNLAMRQRREEIPDVELAKKVERHNLGYYAGYYDSETRERVERLFKCCHPVFGAIAEKGQPTPEEAFELGQKWAREKKSLGPI